jgi:hypothetical protein
MHGKLYHPTWTRLAQTVAANSSYVYLQDNVNWEVGQQILILTTIVFDCPAEYQSPWCLPCFSWQTCGTGIAHQNEIRTIVATSMDTTNGEYIIQIDTPATYMHYAGTEYQGEVALLTRRITMRGNDTTGGFGGHSMVMGPSAEGRFSGVRADQMGQKNVLGRYPFHFHLVRSVSHRSLTFIPAFIHPLMC